MIFCSMERGEYFPLHSRNGMLQFLLPHKFSFIDLERICLSLSFLITVNPTSMIFRDSGKSNTIHQEEEIKGSCDNF